MVLINHQNTYSVSQLFVRLVFWVRTVAFRFWDRLMSHVEPLQSFKTDVLTRDRFHRWRGTLTLTISEEEELRESLTKRNICKFKTQMRRHNRYFYSIAYDAKFHHGNLLEEILNIPSTEVAALFLQTLVMEVHRSQLRKMIKEINLLRYASTRVELLIKLEISSLKIMIMNSVLGDSEGNSSLHHLVEKNPAAVKQCLEQVLLGFEAWANIFGVCYILAETWIYFSRHEDFYCPLLILFLKFMFHTVPLHNIKKVLLHRNSRKQTVLDVAAQVNSKSYCFLVDTLNNVYGPMIPSFKLRVAEHCIVFLIFFTTPPYQTFSSLLRWCLHVIIVDIDLCCSMYFRYSFSKELYQGTNRDGIPLMAAMPQVIIKLLDEFLQEDTRPRLWQHMYKILKTKPEFYKRLISTIKYLDDFLQGTGPRFWQQQIYEILKTKPEFYKHLISNRYSDKNRRAIKEKLKQLNFSHPDYSFKSQIISECSRVHVVAMAVEQNREDAAQEKQHITQMCDKMGYTFHGLSDVRSSDEFSNVLKSMLGSIQEKKGSKTPELILVFIMAHGSNGKIFGCEGDDEVKITDLINLAAENTPNDILKFMYFEIRRTTVQNPAENSAENFQAENPVMCTDDLSADDPPQVLSADDPPQVLPEGNSISNILGSCENMHVHMATRPGDVAIQNTFIHYITRHLSLKSSLFIKPHDVSVTVNKEYRSFFPALQLYASPTMDVICEIRVPDHFH